MKIVDFRLVIPYFGTPQIAPDHTIFFKKILGEHAPHPPSNSVCTQCYRATYNCYFIIFLYILTLFMKLNKRIARVGISQTTAKSRQRKFVPSSHPGPFVVVATSHKNQAKVGTLACFDFL